MEAPPPAISFFDSDISALTTSPTLQAYLQALQLVQQEIWKPISAAYCADNPVPCPHPFKIGDTVLVRRHQTKTLEPPLEGTLHRPLDDADFTDGRRNRRMDSCLPRKGCTWL